MARDMDQATRLREQVGALLRVFLVSERAFPSAEGKARYNPLDFQTLGTLSAAGPQRPGDLAQLFGVAPTTLSSVVARLARRGLLDRQPDPEDGRAVRIALTPAGQEMADAIFRQDIRNMTAMLEVLDPEERETLLAMLDRIVARMTEREQSGG